LLRPWRCSDSNDLAASHRQVVLAAASCTLVVSLALIAARVVWFDAYWIFRAHPPWLEITHGANRLIDRQTRRAKILQAMSRSYTVALIGSSTVYHGLDPGDTDPQWRSRIFNAGISALMADELPIVASVVASKRFVGRSSANSAIKPSLFRPPSQSRQSVCSCTGCPRWSGEPGAMTR